MPDFASLPLNTIEFGAYLYRRLLNAPNPADPPATLPATLPAWLTALPPEERQFLDRCVHFLELPDRVRVYLSFCADLTSREIHRLQSHHNWTRQDVIARLAESYLRVLQTF